MCPALALADDSGVLAEGELNDWIVGVLRKSAAREPLNAPVGEESRTEDGYAFIYDFATLYYDKPVLDETSVLLAVSLTSEIYPGPRNIYLGDAETVLTGTYGWQNPALAGDGVFAAFYCLDGLPQSAYWCWAQHDGKGSLTSVQCAIHVMAGEDRYTDAGVIYSLDGGVVTAIHVYGLSSFITGSEVGSNLEAVRSVEDAAQGVSVTVEAASVPLSGAAPFGAGDLRFSGLDYAALTLEGAREALGHVGYILTPRFVPSTTERMMDGLGLLGEEERIPVEEALKAVTIHGAYQYGEEREKGSLTPGKKADLVILDRNPVEAAPEELREIQVLETIKEGKTVFSRKGQK